jgi:hypothetical protein
VIEATEEQRLFFNPRAAAIATAIYRRFQREDEVCLVDFPVATEQSNLSLVVGKFEDAGLLRREKDGRCCRVALTDRDSRVFRSVAEAFTALE